MAAKPRLKVSFSGGETSAYMSYRIKTELADKYELMFVFANTGQENDATLEFVRRCDEAWGLGVVWLEAVAHPEHGIASTHRVINFESATRVMDREEDYVGNTPFEQVIQIYGIPNMTFQPCNRELKLNPMKSYMNSIGWDQYRTAIGIRADEKLRVNAEVAEKENIWHILIDEWPTDKQDVNDFWEDQPFRLPLKEHEGNCRSCWKKSDKKLYLLVNEAPHVFNFNRAMEKRYGWHGSPCYGAQDGSRPRVFFRRTRSTEQLFAEAAELGYVPRIPVKELRSKAARQHKLDFAGCGQSCEPYSMEPA